MPKVSVVVPNYNHARFLRKRIDSILQQTFQDFELILLDDCSTDDSRTILSSYAGGPRIRIEFNDANSGSTFKQWNKGVRLARGKYVWIAESDDYADPRLLERLVTVLDADPKIAFTYCRSRRVSVDDDLDGFADFYLAEIDPHRWTADYCADGCDECRNYFVRANSVPNASSVVFQKVLYEYVGGADESLHLCGDWKLWASLALTGNVAYLAEPLNYFRFHDASVRSKSEQMSGDVVERLRVVGWVLHQVTPTETVLEKLYEEQSDRWVPIVMSTHASLGLKRAILRSVKEIDPHPIRTAVRPALATMRFKVLRHWNSVRARMKR
ncbi:MAG: glycosyltransferase family 2 protein [Candidatus Acidiferrales bacterium]